MYVRLDREYEIKCTLGTIRDIESRFGKSFYTLMTEMNTLTTTEQIVLLYIGAKRADPTLSEEAFLSACENTLGLGDLSEYIENFILQLQYPGLSKEEVQQKLEKKLRAAESLRGSTGTR